MTDLEDKLFLVGLGAQKVGSTWLARYLGTHPDVFVSRLKELHYFDAVYVPRLCGGVNDRMARLAKEIAGGLDFAGNRVNPKKMEKLLAVIDRLQMTADRKYPYKKFFEDRVTDQSVFCDITPGYSLLEPDGFEAILNTHPRVRFIFLMRDPVDRFWSALRMGVRKMKNFDPSGRFMELLSDDGYFLRSDYKRTIEALEKVVPADQIKYVFYENLFTDATAAAITSYINVEPWPAKFDQVVNPGAKIPLDEEKLKAAYRAFEHVYEFVFECFGDATPERWRATAQAGMPG